MATFQRSCQQPQQGHSDVIMVDDRIIDDVIRPKSHSLLSSIMKGAADAPAIASSALLSLALALVAFVLYRRHHRRRRHQPDSLKRRKLLERNSSLSAVVSKVAAASAKTASSSSSRKRLGLQRSCSSKRDLGRLRLEDVVIVNDDDDISPLVDAKGPSSHQSQSPEDLDGSTKLLEPLASALTPVAGANSRLNRRSPSPAVSDGGSSTVSVSSAFSASTTPPTTTHDYELEGQEQVGDDKDDDASSSSPPSQQLQRSASTSKTPCNEQSIWSSALGGFGRRQKNRLVRPSIDRRHTTAAAAVASAPSASSPPLKQEAHNDFPPSSSSSSSSSTKTSSSLFQGLRRRQRQASRENPSASITDDEASTRRQAASLAPSPRHGSITRLTGREIEHLTRSHLSRRRMPQPYEPLFKRPIPTRSGKVWIPHPPEASQEVRDKTQGSHEIYYEVHGNGPRKAMLIMGLGNTSLAYTAQIQHFVPDLDGDNESSSGRYSICVFDNRGVGNSDCPRGPWRTSELAEDAVVLLDHLGWKEDRSIDLVGVSLGGMIAMELATRIPERLSSLTLCVTTPGHGLLGNMPPMLGLKTSLYLAVTSRKDKRMKAIVDMCFPPAWLDAPADGCKIRNPYAVTNRQHVGLLFAWRIRSERAMTQVANLLQTGAVLTHRVTRDRLAALDAQIPKICILTGDYDCLVDPRNSFELHQAMPSSELIVWEETGHAINIQRPTMFNELLERVWGEARQHQQVVGDEN